MIGYWLDRLACWLGDHMLVGCPYTAAWPHQRQGHESELRLMRWRCGRPDCDHDAWEQI